MNTSTLVPIPSTPELVSPLSTGNDGTDTLSGTCNATSPLNPNSNKKKSEDQKKYNQNSSISPTTPTKKKFATKSNEKAVTTNSSHHNAWNLEIASLSLSGTKREGDVTLDVSTPSTFLATSPTSTATSTTTSNLSPLTVHSVKSLKEIMFEEEQMEAKHVKVLPEVLKHGNNESTDQYDHHGDDHGNDESFGNHKNALKSEYRYKANNNERLFNDKNRQYYQKKRYNYHSTMNGQKSHYHHQHHQQPRSMNCRSYVHHDKSKNRLNNGHQNSTYRYDNRGHRQYNNKNVYHNSNSNYKSKKKYYYNDHHYKMSGHRKLSPNNHYQNSERQHDPNNKQDCYSDYDVFKSSHHTIVDDPELLLPSLSFMSLSNTNNNNHYHHYHSNNLMMSCEEYYAATSYNNESQQHPQTSNIPMTKAERQSIVSLDCEMVGVGESGERSALARVCIINFDYAVLLDTFVKVDEPVTDYRTFVSGIQPEDIESDSSAMDFGACRSVVLKILRNKVLVGHGLENDLSALKITHPKCQIRDTATYPPYMTATLVSPMMMKKERGRSRGRNSVVSVFSSVHTPSIVDSDCSSTVSTSSSFSSSPGMDSAQLYFHYQAGSCSVPSPTNTTSTSSSSQTGCHPFMQLKPRKLKEIAREWLGISIQKSGEEHNPLEDACAALSLYKIERGRWEMSMV